MPKFVAHTQKGLGRGRLYEKSRKSCLARSQICWICAGECEDFSWPPDRMPFSSAVIDMALAWPSPGSPSVDHVIPISILGPDDPLLWKLDNLRPAHLKCNSARGNGKRGPAMVATKTSRNWLA